MAVAFDAKSSAVSQFSPPTATMTSNNMTVGASATALVVLVDIGTNGTSGTLSSISGVTWGGTSMSLIGSISQANGLATSYAFGLVNPASGNQSIVVSATGGTFANEGAYVDAISFTGTSTVLATCFPSANVLTDASTPSGSTYPTTAFSVTTANGDAIVGVMDCNSGANFTGTTQTLIHADSAIIGSYVGGYALASGASTSIQFTGGGSFACCGVAFRVQQSQPTTVPLGIVGLASSEC